MKKLVLVIALALSGCASIVGKTEQPVSILSNPDQATFTVTNKAGTQVYSGLTPATVTLKCGAGYFSGEKYSISYSKDGYLPQSTTLNSSVSGWYWGNLGIGGLLGMLIVDPATGAMYKLPEQAVGTLTKHQ